MEGGEAPEAPPRVAAFLIGWAGGESMSTRDAGSSGCPSPVPPRQDLPSCLPAAAGARPVRSESAAVSTAFPACPTNNPFPTRSVNNVYKGLEPPAERLGWLLGWANETWPDTQVCIVSWSLALPGLARPPACLSAPLSRYQSLAVCALQSGRLMTLLPPHATKPTCQAQCAVGPSGRTCPPSPCSAGASWRWWRGRRRRGPSCCCSHA
mgnify:CR=1 FL=1